MFFVVAAMIEFAVLLHLRCVSDQKVIHEVVAFEKPFATQRLLFEMLQSCKDNIKAAETPTNIENPLDLIDDTIAKERRKFMHNSHKIDCIALSFFPLLFFVFNAIYWFYYLLC